MAVSQETFFGGSRSMDVFGGGDILLKWNSKRLQLINTAGAGFTVKMPPVSDIPAYGKGGPTFYIINKSGVLNILLKDNDGNSISNPLAPNECAIIVLAGLESGSGYNGRWGVIVRTILGHS